MGPAHCFVDVQLEGPDKLWRHKHRFAAEGAGTRITEEVRYLLPFGGFGSVADSLKVKKDVETIFAYRSDVVRRLFG